MAVVWGDVKSVDKTNLVILPKPVVVVVVNVSLCRNKPGGVAPSVNVAPALANV